MASCCHEMEIMAMMPLLDYSGLFAESLILE